MLSMGFREVRKKLYLYNEKEFYIVDMIYDMFYGKEYYCCFVYELNDNGMDMIWTCGVDKFADENVTENVFNIVKRIVCNREDEGNDKIYITTGDESDESDESDENEYNKSAIADMAQFKSIMSRVVVFD